MAVFGAADALSSFFLGKLADTRHGKKMVWYVIWCLHQPHTHRYALGCICMHKQSPIFGRTYIQIKETKHNT